MALTFRTLAPIALALIGCGAGPSKHPTTPDAGPSLSAQEAQALDNGRGLVVAFEGQAQLIIQGGDRSRILNLSGDRFFADNDLPYIDPAYSAFKQDGILDCQPVTGKNNGRQCGWVTDEIASQPENAILSSVTSSIGTLWGCATFPVDVQIQGLGGFNGVGVYRATDGTCILNLNTEAQCWPSTVIVGGSSQERVPTVGTEFQTAVCDGLLDSVSKSLDRLADAGSKKPVKKCYNSEASGLNEVACP
jgi:hypothetical protein